eukprot:m.414195 g.414195  ORF g.414195 m.414195 type:complete len:69 (+) comp21267_c0_seq16:1391-1597(+)
MHLPKVPAASVPPTSQPAISCPLPVFTPIIALVLLAIPRTFLMVQNLPPTIEIACSPAETELLHSVCN